MKRTLLTAAIALLASAFGVQALTITAPVTVPPLVNPATSGYVGQSFLNPIAFWYGTNNANLENGSPSGISIVTGNPLAEVFYKANFGTAEAPGQPYETTFTDLNDENEPEGAIIDWQGPDSADGTIYLYVKDGKANPAYYIFNLTGIWNGTDQILLTGFWDNTQGAISHVSILTSPSTSVPDGGATAALLGLGIIGVGFAARRPKFVKA